METFENDSASVALDSKPGCEVELKVFLKPKACAEAYKLALKNVRSKVSIPGFRKGKAPDAIIKKNYGDAIDEGFSDEVMNLALREMLGLTGIYPWSGEGVPRPTVESQSLEEGSTLIFSFEREPAVPDVKVEELKLDKETPKEINDDRVEEEINDLRKRHATFEEVDAPVGIGSFLRIDLDNIEKDPVENILKDHRIEVEEGELAKWLIDLIIGKKAGEEAEGTTKPPKDANAEEKKRFAPMKCLVKVIAVEEQVLPEDKSLVEQLRVESIEDLQKKTRAKLENEEKQRIEQALREQLWEKLQASYPFELPKSLMEEECRQAMRAQVERLKREGHPDDDIKAKETELEAAAQDEVERRLHTLFMARKVTRDAKNMPSDKEVQQRASELMVWDALSQGRYVDPKQMDPKLASAYRNKAFIMMMQEKAEEHLLGAATISVDQP